MNNFTIAMKAIAEAILANQSEGVRMHVEALVRVKQNLENREEATANM